MCLFRLSFGNSVLIKKFKKNTIKRKILKLKKFLSEKFMENLCCCSFNVLCQCFLNVLWKHLNMQHSTLKACTCSVRIEELFELSDFLCALRLCREKLVSFRNCAAYPKFIIEISVPFLMRTDVDQKIISSFISHLKVWRW